MKKYLQSFPDFTHTAGKCSILKDNASAKCTRNCLVTEKIHFSEVFKVL